MDFIDTFKTFIELPDFDEKYELSHPVISAHNIIIGKMYIDVGGHASTRILGNDKLKSEMKYTKKSWFSKEEYKIEGNVSQYNGP